MLNPAKTDNTMFFVLILFLFYVNGYLLLDVGGKPLTFFLNLLLMSETNITYGLFVFMLPYEHFCCLICVL